MPEGRIKVAMLLASFGPGGIERLVLSTLGPLQQRGIDFVFVTLTHGMDRAPALEQYGINIYPLSTHWKPVRFPLLPFPDELKRLKEILKKEGPIHLVHAHHYACIAAAPRIAKVFGCPYVVMHHNIQEPWQHARGPRHALFRKEMRDSLRGAAHVFAISQAVYDEIEGIAGAKLPQMEILEVRIDEHYFERADPNSVRGNDIIMVGRLAPQKNVLFALECFAELRKKRPSLKAALIGGGQMREQVEQRIQELGLQEVVTLYGESGAERILEVGNRSKVLFMPSLFEGLSAVFLEGMALGLDAVVSKIPGFTKVFPGEPGVTFCEINNLEENVRALDQTIEAYKWRERPEFRKRFCSDDYFDRLAHAYRNAAGKT